MATCESPCILLPHMSVLLNFIMGCKLWFGWLRSDRAARQIQRVGRGRLARRRVAEMKNDISEEERRLRAAVKLQATWRMHTTLSGYRSLQLFQVGSFLVIMHKFSPPQLFLALGCTK
jgi:hypothetical protein